MVLSLTRHNKCMDNNTKIRVKGSVVAAYASGTKVEVWVASPTGDSSDSFQFTIPCLNEHQAEVVAEMWRTIWEIPRY